MIGAILFPVNKIGLFRALHRIIQDTGSAITDYRAWADTYRVYANVEGTFNISQQPLASQFEVLGLENRNTLVVYDKRADKIYTVGTDNVANIYPKKIHCIQGEPIKIITKEVSLKYELLSNLIRHIPPIGQTFIKGSVKIDEKISLPQDPDVYETIRPGFDALELRFARKQDFENIQSNTIFVLSGVVYLRTILPAKAPTPPLGYQRPREDKAMGGVKYAAFNSSSTSQSVAQQTPTPTARVHPVEMQIDNVKNLSEILIREGQYIKQGQIIACLTYNEQQLQLQEQTIQRQIDQLNSKPDGHHSIFLASQKLKAKQREYELQKQIFQVTKKLHDNQAISQIELALEKQKLAQKEGAKIEAEEHFQEVKEKLECQEKDRQFQIYKATLELKGIQHKRDQNKICSAVNARVLLIRPHTIHNNNLTVAIKLLVNDPEPTTSPQPKPKPSTTPRIPKEETKNDGALKLIQRTTANKVVSFLQKTPIYKKTHAKFQPNGGHDAKNKISHLNHSLCSVARFRGLRYQPATPYNYHQPAFFT